MFKKLLISADASLSDALYLINENICGAAFAVDDDGIMVGIITDGDIRRGLLGSISLEQPINQLMTTEFVSLPINSSQATIFEKLSEKIFIIPLLDEDGRPVDYSTSHRHHHIPVAEPHLAGKELQYVIECLETNWISSQGSFVGRFEQEFAAFVDSPEAVSVNSGTAALHLAMLCLGVGKGDEVIVPDLTFAASAAAVLHAGATPVFADVCEDSWCIDPKEVEKVITPRTKAIMPVHLYGQPADMNAILSLARKHDLLVIEDAAEALGAYIGNRHVGVMGDAGAFSFFGNKLITTGEGGMITFKNPEAAGRARIIRSHGQSPEKRYWHDEVGYNYRMTNIQAAIGVAQMERIDEIIAKKLHVASIYREELSAESHITLPTEFQDRQNIYWTFSILVNDGMSDFHRDGLTRDLEQNGIETRPLFYPIHLMGPYKQFSNGQTFPVSENLSRRGLSLPSATTLSDTEVRFVTDTIKRLHSVISMVKDAKEQGL